MPAPFRAQPTLGQYLAWIIECGGRWETGVRNDIPFTKITTAEGRHDFVVGLDPNDRLVPTKINSLDRRLNVRRHGTASTIGDPAPQRRPWTGPRGGGRHHGGGLIRTGLVDMPNTLLN
jgi:hypothetical protein